MTSLRDATDDSNETGSQELVSVLVVDNDIAHARTMGECLSRIGYRVSVVGSGTEGAKKISSQTFDIIVTDLMMNDIGGLEILDLATQCKKLLGPLGHRFFGFGQANPLLLQTQLALGQLRGQGRHLLLQTGQAGLGVLQFPEKLTSLIGRQRQFENTLGFLQPLETRGLSSLSFQRTDLPFDLGQHIIHALQVQLRGFDLALGFAPPGLVFVDPRRLFDQLPTFIRTSGHDLRNLALLDDRVGVGAHAGVEEEFLDVAKPAASGVDQILAIEAVLASRGIAGEGDTGGAILAHIAEHHRLDVHRGAPGGGDVVQTAIGCGTGVHPAVEDSANGAPQLVVRVLRKLFAALVTDDLLVGANKGLEIVAGQAGIFEHPATQLLLFQRILKQAVIDLHHHIRIHLDEAAVAVIGETLVVRARGEARHGHIVQAEIENRVHHAGH